MIPPKPHINLFCNRCIKIPLAILCQEFGIISSIAMDSAVLMCILVLVFEMPWIDAHANPLEPGNFLGLLPRQTAAVVHDVLRLPCPRNRHHLLYHHLSVCSISALTRKDQQQLYVPEHWRLPQHCRTQRGLEKCHMIAARSARCVFDFCASLFWSLVGRCRLWHRLVLQLKKKVC